DRTPLAAQDGRPYAGCYVNANIELWAQDNNYGKRINASLGGVQFLRDGEAFAGGGVASVEDFEDLSNVAELEDVEGAMPWG
ncbi:ssDNA-binding protein, partial [Xylella fastidiosa]